ncbi:MAG TPA: CHAT domain-containing protein [Vicinamibacterales bacterium]
MRHWICLLIVALTVCSCGRESRAARAADEATDALRRGDAPAADSFVERGLGLTASSPQSPTAWRLKVLDGDVGLAMRDADRAARAVQLQLPGDPSLLEVRVRQKFLAARLEYFRRRLPQALALGRQALADAPPESSIALDVGGFVGQLTLQSGRWAEGEAQLESVASRAGDRGQRHIEAMALTSIGMGKFVRNRCDEALPYFERAASQDVGDAPIHATALTNSGMCYARLGMFDRAISAQTRAISAAQKRPLSGDFEQALGQMGNTFMLQGNRSEGLQSMRRAYDAAVAAKIPADAALWAGNLAKGYIDGGDWDQAEQFNTIAKRLFAETRTGRPSYTIENEGWIALGRRHYEEADALFERAIAQTDALPSVVWHGHAGLARSALARGDTARASKEYEAVLRVIEDTRAGLLKDDYKLSYLTELIDFYREYVRSLLGEQRIEQALEVSDSSRGRVLTERQGGAVPRRVSAFDMRQAAARADVVFLSYWLTPQSSDLWIVSGRGIRHVTLPASGEIEDLVRQHQASIASAMIDPLAAKNSAGDALFRLLVAPAEIPSGAHVVIVPDGALHGINFETLPVDAPRRHYWIEDAEIQVAPSLASLTAAEPAPEPSRNVLVLGDATPHLPEFPELTFAKNEIAGIASRFGPDHVTTYSRERATPAAYRDAHPDRFALIHFAAHATANPDSPLDSAVILSGGDSAYKLYARDVAALPLRADLVTVSACRSAGERAYAGEGLVGFAWAFLRAGARRVIAGLWDVSDQWTARLMDGLYQGLASGEPPASALRNAKLELIRAGGAGAFPFRWGAFELFTVQAGADRSGGAGRSGRSGGSSGSSRGESR